MKSPIFIRRLYNRAYTYTRWPDYSDTLLYSAIRPRAYNFRDFLPPWNSFTNTRCVYNHISVTDSEYRATEQWIQRSTARRKQILRPCNRRFLQIKWFHFVSWSLLYKEELVYLSLDLKQGWGSGLTKNLSGIPDPGSKKNSERWIRTLDPDPQHWYWMGCLDFSFC
jgi:hypothetical protein